MSEVRITHLTRTALAQRRAEIERHLAHCCRAQDGTCPRLADLAEVRFLLGEAS